MADTSSRDGGEVRLNQSVALRKIGTTYAIDCERLDERLVKKPFRGEWRLICGISR